MIREGGEGKTVFGTFTGDGTRNRKIDLGFTPRAVLVFSENGFTGYYEQNGHYDYYGGLALEGHPIVFKNTDAYQLVAVTDGGFTVDYYNGTSNHCYVNQSNELRFYVAWA